MNKLNFQDAAFLRLEAPAHPFHVGGLMIFAPPRGARTDFCRSLLRRLAEGLPAADPLFLRRLDPAHPASPRWIEGSTFDPAYHLHHYALPQPGRMQDLVRLVSRAHERLLDRDRPLWEWHLIEGLPRGRFALYCKIHHALIDGIGAQRLLGRLLGSAPKRGGLHPPPPAPAPVRASQDWFSNLSETARGVLAQGTALPEIAAMLAANQRDRRDDTPPMPFTAPRAAMNNFISARRCIVVSEFPLATFRRLGNAVEGTINDALLAVCGGALRAWLLEQRLLPRDSLLAGLPVSLKSADEQHGNQLSMMICPLGTTARDPLLRLRRIARLTRRAKGELGALSPTARADFMNLVLLPGMVLTLAHAATALPPPFNVIISNVPGPPAPLYLGSAQLESVYPLSVVTDAQALNITALSFGTRLCIAVTSCPDDLPGIERFGTHLQAACRELMAATRR
jgi:WS/DGAT/MGAT family acyltransferase